MLADIQLLNKLLLKAKALLAIEEFEQANDVILQLHQTVELIFANEAFDKNMFSSTSDENLPLKTILLEIDDFFQREVKNLSLTSQQVVEKLSSFKAANKMKKAYGG